MSEEKEALKQLIMLISDLRAKDEERYASHVEFMNETIRMISAIESQMNKHWKTVLDSLSELNESIKANLDSLLTGINPKGLRETSKSLKEIMDTMNKSVQTMNLEKVLSELKVLKSGEVSYVPAPQPVAVGQQPEPITSSMSLKPSGLAVPGGASAPSSEPEWVDPHEKKKKEEEDQHLLKPSDFFGS
ncbi:MAG: hypothetical protein ACFFB0_09220 [Promethearchaeota archaeon]